VAVVPNGVDCARYAHLPAGRRTGPPTVMFLGAMSWEPNVAAAEFLARDVLPALLPRVPDVRLRIVGRDPTPRVQRLAGDRVEVTGSVPDVLAPLADAHVLAVPLLAGGGTRLKILEAFAAGLPVVSTPVGCEGIAADPDRHLVVAETPAFAEALARTLLAPEAAATMAAAARVLARDRYDWDAIGAGASAAIRQAVMAATGLRTTTAGR
jgi:glycosyltransferase involved in cell wall biosynthesis